MDLDEQREIEEGLRKALDQARTRYDSAKQEHVIALGHREDLGVVHPDGNVSLRQATKALRIATNEYGLAVLAFNEFILRGRLPKAPEAPTTQD